ncbi:MAG: toll/interleukin-1 receptor domain-containing protein [Catenulispora sp.]|nr:toll/interleukin-1 receptor domain-containing protein [Catenulispora sp.]
MVYQYLAHRFGAGQVFKSGQSIPAGADFADRLLIQAATSEVMLVLIGPGWLAAAAEDGTRKLDHDDDWVRREIATALHNRRHVVPLLLGDEVMLPAAADLPPDIAQLARCQFVRLYRSSADFGLNKVAERLVELVPGLAVAAQEPVSGTPIGPGNSPDPVPSPIDVRGGEGTTTTIIGGSGALSAATGKHAVAVNAGNGARVKVVQRARQWAAANPVLAALLFFALLSGGTFGMYQVVEAAQGSPNSSGLIFPGNGNGTEPGVSSTTSAGDVVLDPQTAPTTEASTPTDAVTPSAASVPRFDPPLQFDANSGIPVDINSMTWGEDGSAFAYQPNSSSSGPVQSTLWRYEPMQSTPTWQVPLSGGETGTRPALAPVRGKPSVIALYVVDIPPNGTIPGHPELHAEAVDAVSGSVDWDTMVFKGADSTKIDATVAGSDDAVLAVDARVDNESDPYTVAVSSADGAVRWTSHSLEAKVVARGVIVAGKYENFSDGNHRFSMVGVSEGNPSQVVWSSPSSADDIQVLAEYGTTDLDAGPHLVQPNGSGSPYSSQQTTTLDAATGKPVNLLWNLGNCRYDHQATVVCSGSPSADGFDATTWKKLWSLPDAAADRSAPNVTAAWHGVVYGAVNGIAVALDARTGADKTAKLSVAPDVVRPGIAVVGNTSLIENPDREYPATQ